jgi:fumarate reductase flavoprotein subunit
MAEWVRSVSHREPDRAAIDAAIALCERPFRSGRAASLEPLREKLHDVMWEKVGILRDAASLQQAQGELQALDEALDGYALPTHAREFNLTWHDWLNLKSLVAVSRVIALAAAARRESRGAHFRTDYPESGSLEHSAFTSIKDSIVTMKPVSFTRVSPGQTLLRHVA